MAQQKIDFDNLETGYEFNPADFQLTEKSVLEYLDAVEGNKDIYLKNNIVPPMAIAALAMTAMGKELSMPAGAVHVSQDLDFYGVVGFNESLTSYAKVNRKIKRGRIHMLSIGIDVKNKENSTVLTGETSFILPQGEPGGGK